MFRGFFQKNNSFILKCNQENRIKTVNVITEQ